MVEGTIYLNHGRYWWKIKLPGEQAFRQIPLKPVGSKFATKDLGVAKAVVEDLYKQLCQKKDIPLSDCKTVSALTIRYLAHAENYYNGSREPENIGYALTPLKELYANVALDDFGVSQLKKVREKMIDGKKLCRKVINKRISLIQRMFKWAVSEQLCSIYTYQTLMTLESLRYGRSAARESKRVLPVPVEHVEAVLPFLSRVVADIVKLQLLTGMRSTELCTLRPCDIDKSVEETEGVWLYRPKIYKGRHIEDYVRIVFIGPKAQNILRPYLLRLPASFCFTPEDAEKQTGKIKHKKYKPCYDRNSYRKAIQRAIAAYNKPIEDKEREIPHWNPHRIRHTRATEARATDGIEVSRALLGQRTLKANEIYAEQDLGRATKYAKKNG